MHTSKVSSKAQITLPRKVREALGAKAGDMIVYEVHGDEVKLKRLDPFDAAFHRSLSSTLDEWTTDEDEEAFRDL